MKADRGRDIESLCLSALARRAEDRAAFLDEACSGDAALLREVQALLARASGFLQTPAWDGAPTQLAPGTRLGPYEVEAAIGAGGMGEVYRARDTRLDRTVAIKVLLPEFSADPAWRARFQREAKTIAGLNHPHICTLHDVGEHPSPPRGPQGRPEQGRGATGSGQATVYLVMELLAGETLAARLAKGPLPLEQALCVGEEIADALAAAHRQGVVHRDLKPGNVMLTASGAKLLDFGLAKTTALAGTPTQPATGAAPLTDSGVIVGTFHYMAPEQLQGQPVDARTDVFAFGAVLYEMLTGQRAFQAETRAGLISSVLTTEPPPVSNLQPLAPPALDRAIRRCLAKDPAHRWQCSGDLASEIRWLAGGGSQAMAPGTQVPRNRNGARRLWAAVATLSLALTASLAVIWIHSREAPAARPPVRFTVAPPAPYVMGYQVPALSPDGTRLAFWANRAGEPEVLFVHDFATAEARVVPETVGANSPFWSPDGRQVGFFSGGRLRVVALAGGSPVTLAAGSCCGTWGRDGEILFTDSDPNSVIMRVSSNGGVASPVVRPDPSRGEIGCRWPVFLPDSRHFLYEVNSARPDVQGIYVASLGSAGASRVMPVVPNVAFVPPDLLVYRSGGRLLARVFDWKQSRLVGNAMWVSDMVGGTGAPGWELRGPFGATPDTLAYMAGTTTPSVLKWLDRKGNGVGVAGEPGDYSSPAISPDWRTVAVGQRNPATQMRDIWLIDLERGTQSRFTSDPADDMNPTWSPDGRLVAFSSTRKGQRDIYVKAASGVGEEQPVLASLGDKSVECWSADGRLLLYNSKGSQGQIQVWAVPAEGEHTPYPVLSGPAGMRSSSLSPNGRFIAYHSDESERDEVFVETFPRGRDRWQISTAGGTNPRWRPDGQELFYREGDKLLAVDIKVTDGRLVPGVPHELFEAHFVTLGRNQFVPSRDGQKFLAVLRTEQVKNPSITVDLNWTSRLKQ